MCTILKQKPTGLQTTRRYAPESCQSLQVGFAFHLFCRHDSTRRAPAAGTRVLLEAGAEVDPVNKFGDTPLLKAVRKKHASTAAVLLEAGANQALRDAQGLQVQCSCLTFQQVSSTGGGESNDQRSTETRRTRAPTPT